MNTREDTPAVDTPAAADTPVVDTPAAVDTPAVDTAALAGISGPVDLAAA